MASLYGQRKDCQLKNNHNFIFSNIDFDRLCRVILGTVFIIAGIMKMSDPYGFAIAIFSYKLFPLFSINLIAIVVPFIELVVGITLLLQIYPVTSVFIINSLLIIFIISISINLLRGQEFDCGCFSFLSSSENRSSAIQALVRDMVLILVGSYVFY